MQIKKKIKGIFQGGKATWGNFRKYRVQVIRLVCFSAEEGVVKLHVFRL
jgi:hypothetical protein